MLLTGHSRGASIANILGCEYEESAFAKMYTYTFSPMKSTLNPKDSKTIFNVYDKNDFYNVFLSFKNEKFENNGTDIIRDISINADLQKKIGELKGGNDYTGVSKEFLENYIKLFENLFEDRNSLYEFKEKTITFSDEQAANAKRDELTSLIDDSQLGLKNYISFNTVYETNNEYSFIMTHNNAAVLQGLAKLLAYGNSVYEGLKVLYENDESVLELYSLVNNNLNNLNNNHYLINDYVFVEEK